MVYQIGPSIFTKRTLLVGSTTNQPLLEPSQHGLRIHTFDQIWRMPQEDTDWTWTGQTVVTSCCNWISCFVLFKDGNSEYGYGIYIYRLYIYIELYIYVVDVFNTCVTVHI